MTLTPGSSFGPYEIRSLLGAGGMGEVYLALDTRLRREVALKVLPEDGRNDAARRRLLAEARHGARLDHPNICAIYEVGEHQGHDYIAMQRIPGVTLDDRLPGRALAEDEAIRIALQVGEALTHAHAEGVLHRDLKPANVMVTPEGRAVVLDFGIARATGPAGDAVATATHTAPGAVAGTPSAMSPEQARGEPLDARTDVFSFGTMLYRMLSGHEPFTGPSPADTISAVLSKEPPPLPPGTRPEMARIVFKCLEKDRALRYGSMREVVVDLERLRRGTTTEVAAGAPARRMRPATRRVLVAVFSLALVALAAIAVWKPGRRAPAVHSLAVLPFRALVAGTAENYLGLGIADAVISRVSRDSSLVVRPTSAVRRYVTTDASAAQAAKELGVDAVVEGTWQREGGRLRVTANLLRRSDGVSLWSDRFDAESGDIFAIQDTISALLADRLRTRLFGPGAIATGGTEDPRAYDEYAKGLFYFSERGFQQADRANCDEAILHFKEAVRLDPGYALAHTQLAYAYVWTALFIDVDSTLVERAERELEEAERIEPRLSLIRFVRSQILYSRYRNWRMYDAIVQVRRAGTLGNGLDDEVRADFALHLGLEEEWRHAADRLLAQDPMNHRVRTTIVTNAFLLSRPELGKKLQKELLDEPPDVRYWSEVNDVARTVPDVEEWARAHPLSAEAWIDLASARAMQGRCREADSLARAFAPGLARDRAYHHMTFEVAQLYGRCGNAPEAVRWLDETVRWGFPAYPLFARDPWFDPVRKSPEFVAFMERLKPEWERLKAELLN